eukprot:4407444-Amphidinium_carterae.1
MQPTSEARTMSRPTQATPMRANTVFALAANTSVAQKSFSNLKLGSMWHFPGGDAKTLSTLEL